MEGCVSSFFALMNGLQNNLVFHSIDLFVSDEEWDAMYMGDDGQFTFYVDLVKGEYAKSSLEKKRYKIDGKTCDEMFKHIRTLATKKQEAKK